jgi:uncharacterized protein YjbJ (UPF0337 family)
MDNKKTPEGQQLEGEMDQVKGRVKEAWGSLTNDNEDRLEGQMDQIKGKAKEEVGEARRNLRDKI